jgi:hypothetical protein
MCSSLDSLDHTRLSLSAQRYFCRLCERKRRRFQIQNQRNTSWLIFAWHLVKSQRMKFDWEKILIVKIRKFVCPKKFDRLLWIVTMNSSSLWLLYEITSWIDWYQDQKDSIVRYFQLKDSFYLAESIGRFVAKFDVSKVCFFAVEWFSSSDLFWVSRKLISVDSSLLRGWYGSQSINSEHALNTIIVSWKWYEFLKLSGGRKIYYKGLIQGSVTWSARDRASCFINE